MSETTVQSVVRAMDILESLAQAPAGLTLAELASRLGLKTPTLHHLLATLASRGYVQKQTQPTRYRLGPAPGRLGASSSAAARMAAVVDAMRELSNQWPEATVVHAVYSGGEVMTDLRVSPDQPGVVQRPVHQVMSPYTSASGLAFLAFADAERVAMYAERYPFDEFGAHRWKQAAALEAFLAEARSRGVLVMPDHAPLLRVAAPCRDGQGQLDAVLGASMPARLADAPDTSVQQLSDAVRRRVAAINH